MRNFSDFITAFITFVVFLTITNAPGRGVENLQHCNNGMRHYFGELNSPFLSCAKHAIKHLFVADFISGGIRLPTQFCEEELQDNAEEIENCKGKLINLFGISTRNNDFLARAFLFHKQAPVLYNNIDNNIPEHILLKVHPEDSYGFKYLEDIADRITENDGNLMHKTPLHYCRLLYNPFYAAEMIFAFQADQEYQANQDNDNI